MPKSPATKRKSRVPLPKTRERAPLPLRGDGEPRMRRPARPFMVVGVGASSGGMEAFIKVLRDVPTNIAAAFVYISHLDPNTESTLDSIFQRETQLPVVMVRDATPIKAGHVYVL